MQELPHRTSGSLIEAQEQERHRIARELHDDINQRLAMLALELEQVQSSPSEIRSRLEELRKQATEPLGRRASLVARVALLKTTVSWCCCGDKELQGIRRAAEHGDRLQN